MPKSGITTYFEKQEEEATAARQAAEEKARKIAAGELMDLETAGSDDRDEARRSGNGTGGSRGSKSRQKNRKTSVPVCERCHLERCDRKCECRAAPDQACRECKRAKFRARVIHRRRRPGRPPSDDEALTKDFFARLTVDHALFLGRSKAGGLRIRHILEYYLKNGAPEGVPVYQTSSFEGNPRDWVSSARHWRISPTLDGQVARFCARNKVQPRDLARMAFDYYIERCGGCDKRFTDWSSSFEEYVLVLNSN